MPRIADVCGNEVLQSFLVDRTGPCQARINRVILDVHPADVVNHVDQFSVNLQARLVLCRDIATVVDTNHAGMIDLATQFGQQLARLTDQVRLDLESVDQSRRAGPIDDLPELVNRLGNVVNRIGSLRVVEGETANQLRVQRLGHADRRGHLTLEVLVKGHKDVVRTVLLVEQLDLANPRTDSGHAHTELLVEFDQAGQFGLVEFDDVFHFTGTHHVDKSWAVIPQPHGSHHRELFESRLVIGRLVGKGTENYSGSIAHDVPLQKSRHNLSDRKRVPTRPRRRHCRRGCSRMQDTSHPAHGDRHGRSIRQRQPRQCRVPRPTRAKF